MRCLEVLSSVAGCFTLPLFKAGQLVQQWVASSSLWAGAGWLAARVIGRKNSVAYVRKTLLRMKCSLRKIKSSVSSKGLSVMKKSGKKLRKQ